MEYEDIWQKIKRMSQLERKLLAFEMNTRGFDVGYIHPHYYFDAKGVHTILFYPKGSQYEADDTYRLLGLREKEVHRCSPK